MPNVEVTHSADGLKAFLYIPATLKQSYPSSAALFDLIKKHGIVYGIDRKTIENMVAQRICDQKVEVASGLPMQLSKPGRIEMLIDTSRLGKPVEITGGRVDHRNLNFVINVRKGEPIMRRIPPVEGKNGLSVFGTPIYCDTPTDVVLRYGNGVIVSPEDPNLIVAAIDGALTVHQDGMVEVKNEKVIQGDIDYSTGNILFKGDLIIRGTVRAGFKVQAEGSIWIKGSVEDATVCALNDLYIDGGASGAGKGMLECGKNLKVNHIENFSAKAGQNISISEDALHCILDAEKFIYAKSIVGGIASAGEGIEADSLGTAAEVKTVIDIGRIPQLLQAQRETNKRIQQLLQQQAGVEEKLFSTLKESMDANGQLDTQTEEKILALRKQRLDFECIISQLKEKNEQLDSQLRQCSKPMVRVKVIHPNTIIKSGLSSKMIRQKMQNIRITVQDEQIIITLV